MAERFNNMIDFVDEDIGSVLCRLPQSIKENTEEIRLRQNLPLALTVNGETVFLKVDGQTCFYPQQKLFTVTKSQLEQSFRRLCNNSAFAHTQELKQGYIRLENGSRAGVFGTVNAEGDMEDITCINIRIAREIKGAATSLARNFKGESWLIAGPPSSGKTTVLRDFARQISNGINGKSYRVAVIDSRGELSGNGANDLGLATDVLNIHNKASGLEIAIRTMNPQVVVFDEIGTTAELKQVKEGFDSGVSFLTTAHIGDKSELLKRQVTRELLLSGVIDRIAVLPTFHNGKIMVLGREELKSEFY